MLLIKNNQFAKSVVKNLRLKWERKNMILKYVVKLKIAKTNFGNCEDNLTTQVLLKALVTFLGQISFFVLSNFCISSSLGTDLTVSPIDDDSWMGSSVLKGSNNSRISDDISSPSNFPSLLESYLSNRASGSKECLILVLHHS